MHDETIKNALKVVTIFTFWTTLHYFSAHIYVRACVPLTMSGFTWSPLIASTPHCVALRWCIQNGVSMINSTWLTLGTWFSGKILHIL
jgi:hypothetical protein